MKVSVYCIHYVYTLCVCIKYIHMQVLTYLETGLSRVALYLGLVDDNLYDAVPHLLTDVVPCQSYQVQDGVHVPGVVMGILL